MGVLTWASNPDDSRAVLEVKHSLFILDPTTFDFKLANFWLHVIFYEGEEGHTQKIPENQ